MSITAPVRPLADLVDEHRLITQRCRTKGARHAAEYAAKLTAELHERGQAVLAVLLDDERRLVTTHPDLGGLRPTETFTAWVTERARVQRRIRALRAELVKAAA